MVRKLAGILKNAFILVIAAILLVSLDQSAWAAGARQDTASVNLVPQAGFSQVHALLNWSFLTHAVADTRLQRTKTSADNGIDNIIKALNTVENGIERSKLPDSQKDMLMSQVDSNITWFESEKSTIQSTNDLTTARQHALLVTGRWNSIKVNMKKEIGIIACDDMDAKLSDARNASSIASGKIQVMKARGNDTGNLDKSLTSFNSDIDTAAVHSQNARDQFNAISTPANVDLRYAAGLRQLNLAEKGLNSSFTDLRTMYSLFYGTGIASN